MQFDYILQSQRDLFNSNVTKNITFRKNLLRNLKKVLIDNEKNLCEAIAKDIDKSTFECFETELLPIYGEIDRAIKNLSKWSKKKRVKTNIANFPAKSYVMPEPLGCCLVISAWNYPYQLSLVPSISALAAGNTVILKPSEIAPNTSALIAQIVNSNFDMNVFHVVEGGVAENTNLLSLKFDKIFFTGNSAVGKIVYKAAAEHLTPVTLELGGKSPVFVFEGCNIDMAAKRIVWAKFLNAGQTCVAPDYVLVEKCIEIEFLNALKSNINKYYRLNTCKCDNYTRIINEKHFDRLMALIDKKNVFIGGNHNRDRLFISPTIMRNVAWDDDVMKYEIFGPILPVITFDEIDEIVKRVRLREKPLACYVYSTKKWQIDMVLDNVSFGGGCVNDSLMQLSNNNLPFGGVGNSGMGRYYGEAGFINFSNMKSILHKSFLFEPNFKYFPYTKRKLDYLKKLI